MHRTALMWFRRDLRIADNPALLEAADSAETVAAVYVSPEGRDPHAPGASFLARSEGSLAALAASLGELGCGLTVLAGDAPHALARAAAETGATTATCTRDWTPAGLAEEKAVAASLAEQGITLHVRESQQRVAPGSIATDAGTPFRVFTPFHRAWMRSLRLTAPDAAPKHLLPSTHAPTGAMVPSGGTAGLSAYGITPPAPGEANAHARLEEFVGGTGITGYAAAHDLPAIRGTSELSAALACGELSPRQVAWSAAESVGAEAAAPFLRQLAWREFAHHVLAADPDSLDEPWRRVFSAMPWRDDPDALAAWTAGRSGWPLVDAGMRQLAETGWMHNRVRMLAASVLTKDLLVPWQSGAAVFERMLVDYDPAVNVFNWQWVAGSGADAAPYFRIFNPTTQGMRFDPDGAYVRRWVPELAALPARYIHRPWAAPAAVLTEAGVRLGETYPHQLIDHAEARQRALAAFSAVKGS